MILMSDITVKVKEENFGIVASKIHDLIKTKS